MTHPNATRANIIPALRYQQAPAAIDWLRRAFGFEKHLVVPGEGDTIAHAQLTHGNGMIMLGSAGAHAGVYDELMATRIPPCAQLPTPQPTGSPRGSKGP